VYCLLMQPALRGVLNRQQANVAGIKNAEVV
jgi:hypothetical protein